MVFYKQMYIGKQEVCQQGIKPFCFCSGKGESIWDRFAHAGGHVYNNDTGGIAADGYHHYLEDIRLIKSLQVRIYFPVIGMFTVLFNNLPKGHRPMSCYIQMYDTTKFGMYIIESVFTFQVLE